MSEMVRPYRASPRARKTAERLGIAYDHVQGSSPSGHIVERDIMALDGNLLPNWKPQSTPLAAKIAGMHDVPLHNVEGSGFGGKITRRDVERWLQRQFIASSGHAEPSSVSAKALSPMRKVIGKRMLESTLTIPHVTLHAELEVSELIQFREQLRSERNMNVTYNDLIVKASADALVSHPDVHVSIVNDRLHVHEHAHVGIAVALERGLIVPVIKDADQKSVAEIAGEARRLIELAKDGRLREEQLRGGTFTITNLGMYEVDSFTPIINPHESAILGVGRIREQVIVQQSALRIGKTMNLSLSFDHRAMDGAPAAAFLKTIKAKLENPFVHLQIKSSGKMSSP